MQDLIVIFGNQPSQNLASLKGAHRARGGTLRREYSCREKRRHPGQPVCGNKPLGGRWHYGVQTHMRARDDLFVAVPKLFNRDAGEAV